MDRGLDLAVACGARPLTRLTLAHGDLNEWLTRNEQYVRDSSGKPPDPPPARPGSLAAVNSTSYISDLGVGARYTSPKDTAEFDKRLNTYLRKMRANLPENVLREFVKQGISPTRFSVTNDTDDPVTGVRLVVRVPKLGLLVYTHPPHAHALPPFPKWPNPASDMFNHLGINPTSAVTPDFLIGPDTVTDKGDHFEVIWDVGDLRPQESSGDLNVAVVPGPLTPEHLTIDMVESAMDRRGISGVSVTLKVSPDTLGIGDFYDAYPAN